MFELFKKKSELDTLHLKYRKLLEGSHKLQSINRTDSDKKYLEADNVLKKIEEIQSKK